MTEVTIDQAFQMGREAFLAGLKRIPVNDPAYMAALHSESRPATIGMTKAWLAGWMAENEIYLHDLMIREYEEMAEPNA
jgi:hypothetical protein